MCYREAIPAVSCLKCNIPTLPYWNFAVHSQWSDLTFHDQSFVFLTPTLSQSGILFLLQSLSLYPANMLEFYWMNMKRSFLHHVHEVTVLRSLFFLALRELLEFWCTGGKWVKEDWEAKDEWRDMLHGCLSHPLSVSFLLFSIVLQPLLGKTKVSWQLLQLHS